MHKNIYRNNSMDMAEKRVRELEDDIIGRTEKETCNKQTEAHGPVSAVMKA